ncbi:hypothetical protein Raf01_42580 [Rugosimonospora africana]|uniref:Uncharacterized protein n=1 Tax=Rugosimonospora africana TaxID=556532 RepID=A0A8J3QWN1_9ACTN|nr:hypothetical protein Raf01_42580 [Rugosimonospora africana]
MARSEVPDGEPLREFDDRFDEPGCDMAQAQQAGVPTDVSVAVAVLVRFVERLNQAGLPAQRQEALRATHQEVRDE